jgi:DNA repair protein RadD
MNRTLHGHQELAIGMLRQSLASGSKRPVLQAPTGAGKTILSSSHHRDGTGEGQAGALLCSSA